MSINFFDANCQTHSNRRLFGLCDDPPPPSKPAYIDENNGAKWIAIVQNEYRFEVVFTAIDNCIVILDKHNNLEKRCDGFLAYNSTVILVELKERGTKGNDWIKEGEEQLRNTIIHFEKTFESEDYNRKKSYIANSEHPKFRSSQSSRMNQFFIDTGYVLRIENRILLD